MQQARGQRSGCRAKAERDRQRTEDRADRPTSEDLGDHCDEDRSARALHKPEKYDEAIDQQHRRVGDYGQQAGGAGHARDVGQGRRRTPPDPVRQPAHGDDADHRQQPGEAKRTGGRQRIKTTFDQKCDRVRQHRVGCDRSREIRREQTTERAGLHNGPHCPVPAVVGFGIGAQALPGLRSSREFAKRQQQQQRQKREHKQTQAPMGIAPANRPDHQLCHGRKQQHASADGCVRDRRDRTHARAEPTAEQARCRHHAKRRCAKATADADAGIV